jgi:8-oxo-dGTP pyrophosphatase MutT (NUDIX family)
MKSIRTGRRQYAVLPISRTEAGDVQVLLITSRDTGRWVIPRGWPMKGSLPQQAALIEAYEEAGLVGRIIRKHKIGSYHYRKMRPSGMESDLKVDVFLMAVDQQLADWPEKAERTTRWFEPKMAASLVAEAGLAKLIGRLPRYLAAGSLSVGAA